ncbi:MAG: ABC transporter ATP-binding protein [Gammaproteobacteria bacterium]|nr:ABC transporter ATP-binding protein [Gammaproteobacteria bacterium]
MRSPMVTIQKLTYYRGHRRVLDRISIEVPEGKTVGIMGPSGSGKTTLLRLIGAQMRPDAGRVLIAGTDIHQLGQKELYRARRKMGLLFQSNALFTDLTVFENVAFPLREHTRLDESLIKTIVLMKLEAVGLRGVHGFMPDELSGGMARRVALARALVFDPKVMMYDEPFTGQDPISKGVLMRLIKRTSELLGGTTILVSHDIEETCQIADYLYLIAGGRVIDQGTPQDLKASSSPKVKQFMHGEADGAVPFHYPASPLERELLDDIS